MTTILVRSPQRADLRGFVFATTLLWFILTATVSVVTGHVWAVGFGALTAAVFTMLGLWRPQSFLWSYRVFNRLAAEVYRLTAIAVGLVCFYFVIGAASLSASRLQRAKPAGSASGWRRREPLEVTSLWQSQTRKQAHGWVRGYASWATNGGRVWAWCLLPFLMILSTLQLEDEDAPSSGNYTLY